MTFIRAGRVRELLKLTRKVWEARRDHNPDVRGESLVALAQLLGAPAGIFVQDTHFFRGGKGPLGAATPHNVEALLPGVVAIIANRTSMPLFAALIERTPETGQSLGLARSDCFTKREWERSPFVDTFLRPVFFDDNLAAIKTIGARGHVLGFNFLRERGEKPFTEEDRALLELFTDEAVELLHTPTPSERWNLTRREAAVLSGIQRGESNKDLAVELACSVRTIETHVANILRKANAPSRAKLAAMANRLAPDDGRVRMR